MHCVIIKSVCFGGCAQSRLFGTQSCNRPRNDTERPRLCYRIIHYAKFVEGLKDAEEAPGCEHCTDNRLLLEHAWQVVANEFYDSAGQFSQAKWADQLLRTFQVTGFYVV